MGYDFAMPPDRGRDKKTGFRENSRLCKSMDHQIVRR